MSDKEPYVLAPKDVSSGRPATFIFLHGFADEAEGLPLGLAQQFQFHNKLPYFKWLLPNAPIHPTARVRAWYAPKALSSVKLEVPGMDVSAEEDPDDEAGIIKTCAYIDDMVKQEIENGVEPNRIVVGGFSQGCAISLVWSQVGKMRDKVAGVVGMSGYFPLADRIDALRTERRIDKKEEEGVEEKKMQYFYIHGTADAMVPMKLFVEGVEKLSKYVNRDDIEGHVYQDMGHSTNNHLLRDLLGFLGRVVPL
jgi:predicted esterase